MRTLPFYLVFVLFGTFAHAQATYHLNNPLQARLEAGETPKDLLKSGIPMDSVYGLYYQGGYIFHFFTKDSSGIVFGPKDLAYGYDTSKTKVIWSCRNIKTGANGTAIGTGRKNTQKIHDAQCPLYDPDERRWMIAAAELCINYKGGGYDDWFLPSKNELHQACLKLSQSGKINFNDKSYWTSTEYDPLFAWIEHFRFGPQKVELFGQSGYRKFYDDYVRPARIFK